MPAPDNTTGSALDPQVVALAQAIRQQESGGKPGAVNAGSGAMGAYQYMPKTWAAASAAAGVTTPLDKASLAEQNQVAYTQIKGWKDQGYNPGEIASMWYTGKPDQLGNTTPQKGGNPSPADYVKSVYGYYNQAKSGQPLAASPTQPAPAAASPGPAPPAQQPAPAGPDPTTASALGGEEAGGNLVRGLNDLSGGIGGEALSAGVGAANSVLFGTGPVVGGAVRYAANKMGLGPDQDESLAQSIAAARGIQSGIANEAPLASDAGDVAGALIGGAGAFKLLSKMAPAAVLRLLQPTVGGGFAGAAGNIAKMGVTGAALSVPNGAGQAITNAVTGTGGGNNPLLTNAAAGAVGGAVFGSAGQLLAKVPLIQRLMASAGKEVPDAAARALGRIYDNAPPEVQAALDLSTQQQGAQAALAHAASPEQAQAIRNLLKDNPVAATRVEAANTALTTRNSVKGENLDYLPPNPAAPVGKGSEEIYNATKAQADAEYGALRQVSIPLAEADKDMLIQDVRPYFGGRDWGPIAKQIESGALTGDTYDTIRQKISGIARSAPNERVYGLLDDITDLTAHDPRFAQASANFRSGMKAMEGAQLGEKILSPGQTAPNYIAQVQGAHPLAQPGIALGVRSALSDAAKDPASAAALDQRLATDRGLRDRISATLGPRSAFLAQSRGQGNTAATATLARATPTSFSTPGGLTATELAHTAGALTTGSHYHAVLAVLHRALGETLSKPAQAKLGTMLADPRQARAALGLLQRMPQMRQHVGELQQLLAAGGGNLAVQQVSQ